MRIDVEVIGSDPKEVSTIVCERLGIINLYDFDIDYFNREVTNHFYFGARRGTSRDERIVVSDTLLSFWFDVKSPFWRSIKELASEDLGWNWYVCVREGYWEAVTTSDNSLFVPFRIDVIKTVFAGLNEVGCKPEYKKVADTEVQMPPW